MVKLASNLQPIKRRRDALRYHHVASYLTARKGCDTSFPYLFRLN